ncbi:unnamed protein product [Cylicocyclus nassatus]|uniref:Uncharacterized protein n=1 Tax=Cylicocyclus nassatus TaxID=53992 RepID=A0AA36MBU6_CYLNA|nr:unnamed protein product [Cylicocyclus nassatus]
MVFKHAMWIWKGFILAALLAVVSTKKYYRRLPNRHPIYLISPTCITDKDGKEFCMDEAKCSSCETLKDERKKRFCSIFCELSSKIKEEESRSVK